MRATMGSKSQKVPMSATPMMLSDKAKKKVSQLSTRVLLLTQSYARIKKGGDGRSDGCC
jgi:hypothetical protein